MRSFLRYWRDSTFKREFALITFVAWFFGVHLPCTPMFLRDIPTLNAFSAYYTLASTLMWGYIASAFSMDFWFKQVKGGSEAAPGTAATTTPVPAPAHGVGART